MVITEEEALDVTNIFDLAQRSTACHLKHAHTLKQALEKDNQDENELFTQIQDCLIISFFMKTKENAYVQRIINFMAVFATLFRTPAADDDSLQFHPLLEKIFKFALELSHSSSDSHRYWSCTLLNRIFQDLEELTDELYEEVKDSMLQRLKDTKASIRCQAIIALYRLQDPYDKEDPIIEVFCNLLALDANAKVRQLCLEKIAVNKRSLPIILIRIRDVNENVRLAGFKKMQPIAKCLKISERRLILQCGFFDSSEKINNFTATILIQAWLESYDNDYLKLMESIRFDACDDDIKTTTRLTEVMLKALFKSASIETIFQFITVTEKKVIEYEKLNWENVFYYRAVVDFLRKTDGFEDHLNKILPELVDFCKYIKEYFTFIKECEDLNDLQHQFFVRQFFLITQGHDVCDTTSRQCLTSLVHFVIQNEDLSTDTAEVVLQNLEKTILNITDRSIFVCEIISNVAYGDKLIEYDELEQKENERKLQVSQLQSDISLLEQKEKHLAYVEKNFIEAELVKEEIETKKLLLKDLRTIEEPEEKERKTDAETMKKCLTIAEAFLRSSTICKFNSPIATLNSVIIQPAIMHEDDRIKAKALKCYALCCVIDYRTARYGIHLFSGLLFATDLTDIEILVTSLNVTVDILTLYGLTLIEKNEDEDASDSFREEEKKVFVGGTSLTDLLQALADHLNHDEPQVQQAAARGICILLATSSVTSSSLLSRIIIKWANPATDNEKLKQFIGLTLNRLTQTTNCHVYFADGILSTIRTLVYAPKQSPLYDVNLDNIIKFLVTLCQTSHKGDVIQIDLAYKICRQMSNKPKVKVNYSFSKVLVLLIIPNGEIQEELLTLCDDLRDVVTDTLTLKNINKFISNLNKNKAELPAINEEESPDILD